VSFWTFILWALAAEGVLSLLEKLRKFSEEMKEVAAEWKMSSSKK